MFILDTRLVWLIFTFEFIRCPIPLILSPSSWTFVELTLIRNWSSTIIWRLRIWSHGFWWFWSYKRRIGGVIVPVVSLKMIEPTDDRQLVVKCSTSGSTPSAPPRPQHQVKENKRSISNRETRSISTRETRSKSVKPAANTGSKSKIWIWTLRASRSLKTW
jgi:hypothetical protein